MTETQQPARGATRWRCTRCQGRRVVLLDDVPRFHDDDAVEFKSYVRCPECTGTDPTAGAVRKQHAAQTWAVAA